MSILLAELPESPLGPHLRQYGVKVGPKLHLLLIVGFVHTKLAILDLASLTMDELLSPYD